MKTTTHKSAIAYFVAVTLFVLAISNAHAAGSVTRFYDDVNPHGIALTIPDGVHISSDYNSKYTYSGDLSRHSPDDIQLHGNRTTVPMPRELYPL